MSILLSRRNFFATGSMKSLSLHAIVSQKKPLNHVDVGLS
jgi:hypothetical protein